MKEQRLTCERIFRHLATYSQKEFTGRVDIQTGTGEIWQVYLSLGQVAWATGGQHPRRRWQRQLDRAQLGSATIQDTLAQLNASFEGKCDCAEYHLLAQLARDRQLDADRVMAIVGATLEEVFFDIVQAIERASFNARDYLQNGQELPTVETLEETGDSILLRSHSGVRPSPTERLPHTWTQSLDDLQARVLSQWQEWAQSGLVACSPNLAAAIANPRILQEHVSPEVYRKLSFLLDGEQTLRDVSGRMSGHVTHVARSLVPYVRRGLIRLERVADLPRCQPLSAQSDRAPLVVCVDDSHVTRQIVEMVVKASGCRFLGVADSSQALETCLEHRPALVFVDVLMPGLSGYEVCQQLRGVSQLNGLPIAMLSGNVIDRVRAGMVGADRCLSKPVEPEQIRSLLQKYVFVNHSRKEVGAVPSPEFQWSTT